VYFLQDNYLVELLSDRLSVVLTYSMYELVLEIILAFAMPIFLAKLRPELYDRNFLRFTLDFV